MPLCSRARADAPFRPPLPPSISRRSIRNVLDQTQSHLHPPPPRPQPPPPPPQPPPPPTPPPPPPPPPPPCRHPLAEGASALSSTKPNRTYTLPPLGNNPSTLRQGTTPSSFANPPRLGTPYSFSSPDTPGMPEPSPYTAWDFLPDDWTVE